MQHHLLTIVTYLPIAGAMVIMLLRGEVSRVEKTARILACFFSLLVLVFSLLLWLNFDLAQPGYQFTLRLNWLLGMGTSYHVGVDGISLCFILLTSFIIVIVLLASLVMITKRIRDYVVVVLLLETALLGLFTALDLVVFYIFYEATLIPAVLLIGIWAGEKRVFTSMQFFLFTFAGSLFILFGLLGIWSVTGTTDIPTIIEHGLNDKVQAWLFWCFVIGFGVKLPLFPLHAWLPDTYTQAPAPVSAVLSGILSKAGGYGLLRFVVFMLPDASARLAPVIFVVGTIGIIYAALSAFDQIDAKRLVAYSSFSHMGLVAVGMFTLTIEGIDGAVFQMLSHGVIITALFLGTGMICQRVGSQLMQDMRGIARVMPILSTLLMLFTMANLGLPGTGAFIGELLVLLGATQVSVWLALFTGTSVVLTAIFMLFYYRRIVFGVPVTEVVKSMRDLTTTELIVLAPLGGVILWMGIYPVSFLRLLDFATTPFVATVR